jgi:hypothetical protein
VVICAVLVFAGLGVAIIAVASASHAESTAQRTDRIAKEANDEADEEAAGA